jgi:prepilin peptidase CpaA
MDLQTLRSSAPIVVAVIAAGTAGSVIDWRTRRIPNWLTAGTAAIGVSAAAVHIGGLTLGTALLGGAVGLLLMLPGYVLAGTGAGDVKLAAAIGTLLGPKQAVFAFIYTGIAGGVLAVIVAIRRRRLRASVQSTAQLVSTGGSNVAEIAHPARNNAFAYAPAIAIGALAALLRG